MAKLNNQRVTLASTIYNLSITLDTLDYLVGGLEHEFYDFPHIGNVIIPTDEVISEKGLNHQPENLGDDYIILYSMSPYISPYFNHQPVTLW